MSEHLDDDYDTEDGVDYCPHCDGVAHGPTAYCWCAGCDGCTGLG